MPQTTQYSRDDAIVLAALPGTLDEISRHCADVCRKRRELWSDASVTNALRRLKRANLARYVRETKRWEKINVI